MIHIDFETRSRTSIKAGASRYSLDAEVMCLSYKIDDGEVHSWRPGEPTPNDLLLAIELGDEVWAHNATFEMAIWRNVMVAKFGWPEIQPKQWRCTMATGMALALPSSLENMAEALKLPVQKDMAGRRLMLKMSKPRKPTKKDNSEWHEKPEDIQRLREYCNQDVVTEAAIHTVLPPLIKRELSVYHFDAKVNLRGVKIDRELAKAVVHVWDQYTARLNTELDELTFGRVTSSDQVKEITSLIRELGVEIDSLNKESVAALLKTDLPPTVRRVLEIRAELAMSSVAKYKAMLLCAEPDDRIRGCFQYHGAQQTGRWAGRLVQLQNLPRGELKAGDIDACTELVKTRDLDTIELLSPLPLGKLFSSLLRSAIIPESGKRLLVCDFASIEARALAWAAGEEWLLDAFRHGKDAYKEMASTIYSVPYDAVTKEQRFYGKQVILGAGYQLGGTKFRMMLANYGVDASEEFCNTVIEAYRAKNKKIKSLWYATEKAAVNAVRTGQPHRTGPYVFHRKGDWLHARMPCGRDISYYKPELAPGKYGDQVRFLGVGTNGKMQRTSTYGGSLVENLTQAVCRDMLVEAMSRLEKAGYSVVMHVHDEIVCEVPDGFGSIEEMEAIMREVPAWAEGFPVDVEGFECRRYRK